MLQDDITEGHALIRNKNSLNYNAEYFDHVITQAQVKIYQQNW